MATRGTPPPASRRPETAPIDDSWDELVVGALRSEKPASGADAFDRATVPTSPPGASGLELDTTSEPPRASPGALSRLAQNPTNDRRNTVPEPVMERYLSRLESGLASAASSLESERDSEPVSGEADRNSPLDLVETYRRATQSLPQPTADGPTDGDRAGRESGTLRDMQDRYAVGDFTGALVVAESILEANPENPDAKRYAQSCREVLTQMYAARLGPMDQVAVVSVPQEQITWLSLDHRAGFLLSLVDGVSSIEEILDVSGMTRLDALRIMYTLYQQNVITLHH